MHRILFLLAAAISLCACVGPQSLAPVRTAVHRPDTTPDYHRVRRGETLYAIAFAYDQDYRDLAKRNRLRSPYALKIGQRLRIKVAVKPQRRRTHSRTRKPLIPVSQPVSRSVRHSTSKPPVVKRSKPVTKPVVHRHTKAPAAWQWPTAGKVSTGFSITDHHKGIDINGRVGQAIHASAAGRVAYAGNGLHSYGNLVIIKHNDEFLSAYAHNSKLLVKEGQKIHKGQVIAQMGNSDSKTVKLHFEIRKHGKPVNPLRYLR